MGVSRPFFFFLFAFISLIADGPHHYHLACGHKGSSHLSPVHALHFFLSRCKFSTLTTRQPMVEFYLLTFPRFPLRKKEHKSYLGKNRTHDFRTSRCAAYLLDHSGDEHVFDVKLWTSVVLIGSDVKLWTLVVRDEYLGQVVNVSRCYKFYVKLWTLVILTVQYSLRAYTSPDVKKCRRAG